MEKREYKIVQGDENQLIWIENQLYNVGDTIMLTDAQAAYRIGKSIEPVKGKAPKAAAGEGREAKVRVDESSRLFNPNTPPEDVEREALRNPRSKTAEEVGAEAAVDQARKPR